MKEQCVVCHRPIKVQEKGMISVILPDQTERYFVYHGHCQPTLFAMIRSLIASTGGWWLDKEGGSA